MAEQNIKSRIQHKHDTQANWNKATNFIPLKGEIVVYDADDNVNYERIKIGDGVTTVINLPFFGMPNVAVTTADNGKFLRVVNGAWAASSIPNAEEAEF